MNASSVSSHSPEIAGALDTSGSAHVKLRSLPMSAVRWTTGFWADRARLCREAMLPEIHRYLLDPQACTHLDRIAFTAGLCADNPGGVDWADGDCYKWIEAMAHAYAVRPDPGLDALMDEWIGVIAKAQEDDGYISSNIGHDRGERMKVPYRHECYNMGHLLTAACIHYRATGKSSFLAVAKKTADFYWRSFRDNPPELAHFPWNPSVYMGLVEMYRATGERRYLETVATMIDNRGRRPGGNHTNGGTDQTQDRVPLREETEAVGHAVCGMYLYCGAADLCAETGDREILAALERIWESVTFRKMDITGSCGGGAMVSKRSDPVHEAFGRDYDLPNRYNETCANIGNGMFNLRMLALTGAAKYADEMERVAYNCLNAAVDLNGQNWFYCNPLSRNGTEGEGHLTGVRWRNSDCYCCPPSVARTTAGIHNWACSVSDDGLWVHLYGGSRITMPGPRGDAVELVQETNYPWNGRIRITFARAGAEPFALHLRIPGWTEDPGLRLNGAEAAQAVPGTYATIRRTWVAGDAVELDLPMPVRLMEARPEATGLANRVAVMRGPLVYCLELPRREGGERTWQDGVFLPENIRFTVRHDNDCLGGVTVLSGTALTGDGRRRFVQEMAGMVKPASHDNWTGTLYRRLNPRPLKPAATGTVGITLIPYFAWANRGLSFMEVWLPLAR